MEPREGSACGRNRAAPAAVAQCPSCPPPDGFGIPHTPTFPRRRAAAALTRATSRAAACSCATGPASTFSSLISSCCNVRGVKCQGGHLWAPVLHPNGFIAMPGAGGGGAGWALRLGVSGTGSAGAVARSQPHVALLRGHKAGDEGHQLVLVQATESRAGRGGVGWECRAAVAGN